ncbi:hypothetical protein [Brucella anthropi]|uniref:hypothetical protein n=1 Tax=Brucella anthropi TaxID=529 RepID=UPI000F66F6AF|nr:hypothetical protein [Brucella anthropi]
MTDEPKDVRLPFMVTASEAKAIDEWRYRKHIPSRAEAMRLLINRGLAFDDVVAAHLNILGSAKAFMQTPESQSKEFLNVSKDILKLTMTILNTMDKESDDLIRAQEEFERIMAK